MTVKLQRVTLREQYMDDEAPEINEIIDGSGNGSPTFEEVGEDSDPTGDTTTRKVQQLGRVDIPKHYLDYLEMGIGEKVFVVCEEDQIRIVKATKDRLFGNA